MVKICSNHQYYKVPLIYTYAWNNYEYWCPFCGCHEGMLGAGDDVDDTEELKKRGKSYEKATEEYLHARSTLICSETKWEEKWIKPSELPEAEKKRLFELQDSWKLNRKVEEIK